MAKRLPSCASKSCHRRRTKTHKLCNPCRWKRYVAKDPVRAAYQTNKKNAKRRGKPHTITLAYFRKFCKKYNYIAGKGKTRDSFSVDCVIPHLGYVPGNIQILTIAENSAKMHRDKKILHYDYQTGKAIVVVRNNCIINDGPF